MAFDTREVDDSQKLDENILKALPEDSRVVSVKPSGESDYCDTYRIEVVLSNGTYRTFSQKEAKNDPSLIESAFAAASALHRFVPEFAPRPLAAGPCAGRPSSFMLSEHVETVDDDIPDPEAYAAAVAALHARSMGRGPRGPPSGGGANFGFDADTRYGGSLAQENGWCASWEEFWTRQTRRLLEREAAVRGRPGGEDGRLRALLLSRVIPRYLRPLETGGRRVTPCLVHGDLWPGNVRYKADQETVYLGDPAPFWGHNEADLGVFRNPRYPLGRSYLKEYWKQVPVSEPEEDADSRNMLYMTRNQIILSILYPHDPKLRDVFVGTMRILVQRVLAEETDREEEVVREEKLDHGEDDDEDEEERDDRAEDDEAGDGEEDTNSTFRFPASKPVSTHT